MEEEKDLWCLKGQNAASEQTCECGLIIIHAQETIIAVRHHIIATGGGSRGINWFKIVMKCSSQA